MTWRGNPYDGGATTEGPESETLYCANHPNTPTTLRCSRCEKPICLRCAVRTPVGYRCFDCAQLAVMPTYAVSTPFYTRAILAGLGVATLVGLVWAFFPSFDFWAALILGLSVGEVVSQAANLKRGPGLQIVAVGAVVWGIVVSRLALAYLLTIPALFQFIVRFPGSDARSLLQAGLSNDFLGRALALFTNNDLTGWLFLAMALVLAYIRLR